MGIWLLALFIYMLVKSDIIKLSTDIIKAFYKSKILVPILLMVAYTTGIVFVLYQINFWNISLLKDTVVLFCFTGILMMINSVTSDINQNFFRQIIVNNIKLIIIVEFIINTYTFSLVGELILIPVVTFIAILKVIIKPDEKHAPVAKSINGLQIIIGMTILIFAISNAVSDYKNFVNLDTLRHLIFVPLLTISFLPFVYLVALFATYELLFIRLDLGFEKSNKLKRYARREIIKHCLLSFKKVNKVSSMNTDLMHIRNEDDVDVMIKYL